METIYQKLGAIMSDVQAVDKTQKNVQQGFMFRGIDDMMNALHILFARHGVIIVPRELDHIQESFATKTGGTQFRSRVLMQFSFVSTEDGSKVIAEGWGESADNGDKGYNKCKSIALKYVLMQMFLIPTKDIADPDKETPEDIQTNDDDLNMWLHDISVASTVDELNDIYKNNPHYHNNKAFMRALSNRKKQIG